MQQENRWASSFVEVVNNHTLNRNELGIWRTVSLLDRCFILGKPSCTGSADEASTAHGRTSDLAGSNANLLGKHVQT